MIWRFALSFIVYLSFFGLLGWVIAKWFKKE